MNTHYDAVIVGGGPAGATAATILAKRGRNVLVLEREQFPRYHVGESLISGIVPVMRELGLEEELDRRYPWKYGVSLVWGNELEPWRTDFNRDSLYDHTWHVDRASFDELLLNNARTHGATVIEQARVVDLIKQDDRVIGVSYTHQGETHTAYAPFTIDASGQARAVNRHLTTITWQKDLRNVAIWRYFDDFAPLENPGDILLEAVPAQKGWFWGIPVSNTRVSVGFVASADHVAAQRAAGNSVEDIFDQALKASKQAASMVANAHLADEPVRTARDFSHTTEGFAGPGWVSVGDAATFLDPLFSSGVWLATASAWLAARAIDVALDHPAEQDPVLSRYEATFRHIMLGLLEYIRYFTDPHREMEDYLEKANAASQLYADSGLQAGFVAFINGLTVLPDILDFEPLADAPAMALSA